MSGKKYQGYTNDDDVIAMINSVKDEMDKSWKLINSTIRENPDEMSVLAFASEGSGLLNAGNDNALKSLLDL